MHYTIIRTCFIVSAAVTLCACSTLSDYDPFAYTPPPNMETPTQTAMNEFDEAPSAEKAASATLAKQATVKKKDDDEILLSEGTGETITFVDDDIEDDDFPLVDENAKRPKSIVAKNESIENPIQKAFMSRKESYYFKFDSSAVDNHDQKRIQTIAKFLKAHPEKHILLTGNTDERGSREYNVALGERRAKRVFDLLTLQGVKSSQIRIVSYGQEKPVALGHNEEAWHLNRRVDLSYERIA